MRISLYESLRAIFYAPYYIALARGAWERQGIQPALSRPPDPGRAALDLFERRADVTWGGPMRMMQYMDSAPDVPVIGFAEAVTRDPFFLVGREPRPDFVMRDLLDTRLATVSEVPTPWMCLQDDLRRAGVDPATVERVSDGSMAENADALRAGGVDVIQVPEPFVETLIREGAGFVWYAAASRGLTSYTTLYTTGTFAADNRPAMVALARGVYETQRWLHAAGPDAVAEAAAPWFDDVDSAILRGAVARYLAAGVWGRDPVLPVVGFVRLKCALLSGGFITRDIPYDSCMDISVMHEAMGD